MMIYLPKETVKTKVESVAITADGETYERSRKESTIDSIVEEEFINKDLIARCIVTNESCQITLSTGITFSIRGERRMRILCDALSTTN